MDNTPVASSLREMVAKHVEEQGMSSGKRLSFSDQCAAFAALRAGYKQAHVRDAFGLSAASVSYLNNCHEARKPGKQKHYPQIAREYERLGEQAFFDHYFTTDMWDRMRRIKHDAPRAGDVRPRGPNKNADREAFSLRGAFMLTPLRGPAEYWRIDWTEGLGKSEKREDNGFVYYVIEGANLSRTGANGPGWRFHVCDMAGNIDWSTRIAYQGTEAADIDREPRPFRTSYDALIGLEKMLGLRE